MKRIGFVLVVIAAVFPSLAQANVYKRYHNARFGYSIDYRSDLLEPQGEAANGDGQGFRSRDGSAELKVWAADNATKEPLRTAYTNVVNEVAGR